MRHFLAIVALVVGGLLYIAGIVTNALILGTSQKHHDKMCSLPRIYCWEWFLVVWRLGIAASVIGLVHTLASLVLVARKQYERRSKLILVGSTVVFILWLATIILGWVDNTSLPIVRGYMGIPEYEENRNYGGRNSGITAYTLTAAWYPVYKTVTRQSGNQGQYRFVKAFIEAMAPAMGKEKFFAPGIREFAHAKQGLGVLIVNHLIIAYAFFTMVIQFHQVVIFRKPKTQPITKEVSPRHSSV